MQTNEQRSSKANDAFNPVNLLICEKYSRHLLYSCITILN